MSDLDEARISLEGLQNRFGISRRTLFYWLKADGIRRETSPDGVTSVRWGDIVAASNGIRWPM